MQDLEQAIRERAYHLWIADGCQDGKAHIHWLTAQREVLATSLGTVARVKLDEKKIEKKARKTAAKGKRRAA